MEEDPTDFPTERKGGVTDSPSRKRDVRERYAWRSEWTHKGNERWKHRSLEDKSDVSVGFTKKETFSSTCEIVHKLIVYHTHDQDRRIVRNPCSDGRDADSEQIDRRGHG